MAYQFSTATTVVTTSDDVERLLTKHTFRTGIDSDIDWRQETVRLTFGGKFSASFGEL